MSDTDVRVQIAPDKRHFTRGGSPWFYLADTAWSALTNATDSEWERYLDYRREQGFTAIQINLLPQWDRSICPITTHPFAVSAETSERTAAVPQYDFSQPNPEYFAVAARRCAAVTERGMVPVVVLLWCNYVPDTWASARLPETVIPREALDGYLQLAIASVRGACPIYMVAGDTDFQTQQSISYYQRGLELVREIDPDGLTTLHLNGGRTDIPDSIRTSPHLDFYNFQSGHGANSTDASIAMAQAFRSMVPPRPVVNAEPCYEGHARGPKSQRYSTQEVRRAAWQSVLSGANAGVTYGAHGIWSWHREGLPFKSIDFSGIPYPWDTAMRFDGAWQYGYLKAIVQGHALWDLEPFAASDLDQLPAGCAGARSAATGLAIIYLPFPYDLQVTGELATRGWRRVDLEHRRMALPKTWTTETGVQISKGEQSHDALLIGAPRVI